MIHLDRLPQCVALAFEAHGRAQDDLSSDQYHVGEFERLRRDLSGEHIDALSRLLDAERRGVQIVPRAAYSPLPWLEPQPIDPPRAPLPWLAAEPAPFARSRRLRWFAARIAGRWL